MLFSGVLAATSLSGQTITVDELAQRLVEGDVRFLLDVRRSHRFAEGHIPNAVNIPAANLDSRRLPPIGEVIVYGDGLGQIDMEEISVILSNKTGIEPVVLQGGFAAWESQSGVTTAPHGFRESAEPVITYQDLVKNGGRGAVIYDLRKGAGGQKQLLKDHFPEARLGRGSPMALLRSSRNPAQATGSVNANPLLKSNRPSVDDLVVLVDDDHESAAKLARRLRGGGLERVVVLAGGDLALSVKGRPGLERRGRGSIKIDLPESGEEEGNP